MKLDEIPDDCNLCPLSKNRTRIVRGDGPDVKGTPIFVGEAPGRDEDLGGKPFIGRAGKKLDLILGVAGVDREGIYITNTVKCRPPDNRNPEAMEMEACRGYLDAEILKIEPKVIFTLGRVPLANFLGLHERKLGTLGDHIGREYAIDMGAGNFRVVPCYHPAACIYNPALVESSGSLIEEWLEKTNSL